MLTCQGSVLEINVVLVHQARASELGAKGKFNLKGSNLQFFMFTHSFKNGNISVISHKQGIWLVSLFTWIPPEFHSKN